MHVTLTSWKDAAETHTPRAIPPNFSACLTIMAANFGISPVSIWYLDFAHFPTQNHCTVAAA